MRQWYKWLEENLHVEILNEIYRLKREQERAKLAAKKKSSRGLLKRLFGRK